MIEAAFIQRIQTIVGNKGLITDAADIAPYIRDWRDNYIGKSSLVVRPANTGEVAAVVNLCVETSTPIVPPRAVIPAWSEAVSPMTPAPPLFFR